MGFEWMTITYSVMGKKSVSREYWKSLPQKKKSSFQRGGARGINMWEINVLSAQFCYEPYITLENKA